MTSWEERMAFRAGLRAEAAEAARRRLEAEEQARLAAEFPAVPGEHDYIETEDPHRGHRTHSLPWHLGVNICSCGEFMGVYCFVAPGESDPEPEPCPVCIARGILVP